jgi:CcmD family protein
MQIPSTADTHRSIMHLYAAYVATWLIIGGYVVYLWRKGANLRKEMDELIARRRISR